jgi:hypothetical protein
MKTKSARTRNGTVLICVLACFCAIAGTIAITVDQAMRNRRELRTQRHLLQTEYLCDAGLSRCKRSLAMHSDYKGEVWSPNLVELSSERAVIEIRCEAVDDQSHHCIVIAKLYDAVGSQRYVQHTKTTLIPKTPNKEIQK